MSVETQDLSRAAKLRKAAAAIVLTRLPGVLLAVGYVVAAYKTTHNLGFSRDESFYFDAGGRYAQWFRGVFDGTQGIFDKPAVDAAWSANHEHPALVKSMFALSWLFLHEKWKWIAQSSQAFRFPGMLFAGLGVYLIYRIAYTLMKDREAAVGETSERRASLPRVAPEVGGVLAAAMFMTMPRMFYHAHLACFDVAATSMWALSIYAYWRAHTRGTFLSILLCGIAYGLLLETKHNAWLMPAVVVPHTAITLFRAQGSASIKRILPMVSMATLGPAIFVGMWPWLWRDTVARIREYIGFHTHHDYYNMEFLGRNYYEPPFPWTYAPVMIAVTVPAITLGLALLGIALEAHAALRLPKVLKRRTVRQTFNAIVDLSASPRVQSGAVILLGFVAPIAVFFLPSTPIFGGTKHWFPAYPFMCVFSGVGFVEVARRLSAWLSARGVGAKANLVGVALLAAVACLPGALTTQHAHPFALSQYTGLAGGTRGGANLGMGRQFWGFTTQSLAPYFERRAKPGQSVFIHDTTQGAFTVMQEEKRIRPDIRYSIWSAGDTDIAIVHHEKHMIEAEVNLWTVYDTVTPDEVLTHDGVPIITVYKKTP
jgi:Dolichyl-phosphate-mannose-protein mannosyltransferase